MKVNFRKSKLFILILLCIVVVVVGCKSLGPGLIENSPEKMNSKYADENSKWIDINGLKVHYKDEGRGSVLVLLHGVLASLHTWDEWVKVLKPHYRVIRLDIPEFGLTGKANFKYNEKNMTAFFETFLKKMNITKFSVVGNSLGGYMAWKIAYKSPEMIDKLILIDAVAYPQEVPFTLRLFYMPVMGFFTRNTTPRWIFNLSIASAYGDDDRLSEPTSDRYYDLMLRKGNRDAAAEVLAYMDSRKDEYPAEIASIKVPTLIMWGSKDEWVPINSLKYWKKDMPQAKIIVYKGAGHIPMEEIPDKTVKDALAFLQGK